MFPIRKKSLKARIIGDLDTALADNTQAWELSADGSYRRIRPGDGEESVTAQTAFLRELAESS
jgi:polyphosphate kinase